MKSIKTLFPSLIILFFISNNSFSRWVQTSGPAGGTIECMTISNNNIYIGTDYGLYKSTNQGLSWFPINNGHSVWKRQLSELIGIKRTSKDIPTTFNLYQNYPNPFIPTTKIKYDLPKTAQVSIKVYDLLGKEVETLINELKQPGSYEINFNGSNLASGVYLYKIISNDYSAVKKMVILK